VKKPMATKNACKSAKGRGKRNKPTMYHTGDQRERGNRRRGSLSSVEKAPEFGLDISNPAACEKKGGGGKNHPLTQRVG